MRKLERYVERTAMGAVLAIMVLVLYSCGGPYMGRSVNQPDEKLAIADDLFERGKYHDAAVDYRDFLAVFAGDDRCDFAQFRVAECYRLDEDYAMAAVEYRILINDYGYSEYIDDAYFLEGLCAFKQTQIVERDQSKSYEALGRINRFLQLFPDSPRRAEAERTRDEIFDILAEKVFISAKLYYSKKHYSSAMIYLRKVVSNYPETVWAARSRYYIGRILEYRGEKEEAAREYRDVTGSGLEFKEKADAERRLRNLSGE